MTNRNKFKKGGDGLTDIDIDAEMVSLADYISIFLENAKTANEQGDGRTLFYRGQPNKAFSLTPSAFRKGLLNNEHTLIHDLLLNSPHEFSSIEDSLERLIKMQHYGLPTRLLDVTNNPLVAMFFACNKDFDKDGEIIAFYDYMQRPNSIDARCIAELAEYSGSSERQMLGCLTEKGFSNIELDRLVKLTHIPIEAPLNNERIRRQHGAFLMVGIHGEEGGNPYQKAVFDLKPYLVRNFCDNISRSIVIPKSKKPELLIELEAFGINQAFLFPELEHQATYIKNKYEGV